MNADTKAGLLAAGIALLTNAASQQRTVVLRSVPPSDTREWLLSTIYLAAIASMVVTALFLLRAVAPRVRWRMAFSRYSWPVVARSDLSDLLVADITTDRQEAWRTAIVLAQISQAKFRDLTIAFVGWVLAALMLLTVIVFAGQL